MAKKDVFEGMGLTDMSYLLDPEENSDPGLSSDEEMIPVNKLIGFKDHPFRVDTDNSDFEELVDSITQKGLIYPILVRPRGDMYEIISGHRRTAACKAAGLKEVRAVVRNADDYEATWLMVHSNLYRPGISISERAKAYRKLRDEGKHQGVEGMDIAEAVGAEFSDSRRKVYRYIRLSYLNDSFLNMVDGKKISINLGIEISYFDTDSQNELLQFMEQYKIIPSVEQIQKIRKTYEKNGKKLSFADIVSELSSEKKKKENTKVTFKKAQLQEYFEPDADEEFISNVIFKLLQKYKDGVLDQYLE